MKLYIDGSWEEAHDSVQLASPYDGRVIAEVPVASEAEVERAIDAATRARKAMAAMPAHARGAVLDRLVQLLEERKEEAAQLISAEAAKPIRTAREEVARTIQTYRFAAQEARQLHGETLPMDAAPGGENRIGYTVREPLGVIGAITPFNFPMNLVAHKVGPAIASGNTIVLKPASQTPLSAYFLAELLAEAGLPAGALNVVTGSGKVVGDRIVQDDRVKMITFTGSPEVGIGIRNKSGLKKVTLELGSNSALIVDKDVSVESIVNRCVKGAFAFQGQVCISLQRIYVHEEVYESFVEQFVKATQALQIGDPANEATDVSAVISEGDATRVVDWVREAEQSGATMTCGGNRDGSVVQPTVLLNVDPKTKVSCQEVFGPVVMINRVSSIEEGIEHVNDSRFGLQAGIYTNDIHGAMDAAAKLEVGGVMINDIPTFRVDHMPYGGVKESGTGREGIKYALEEMTELKLVVINRNREGGK
ncbi:aldehyde dehydrogenase family protein [Alteribacter populi]|uniref:aldehyde dehydrogenase family protein n=1 Tax=Alteribacter populi TaxID=2011011 RepID=UPI000BBA4A71|nr:aldehyde dehydrogenase family protein [Alteribacter populi]